MSGKVPDQPAVPAQASAAAPGSGTAEVMPVPAPAAAAAPEPEAHGVASDIIFGAGVVSSGTFITRGQICVDGTLHESTLEADAISISPGARFEGKARARHMEVFGQFSGELVATEQLVLRASAQVSGKISSPCMVMHRGASVSGEVETMGLREASNLD